MIDEGFESLYPQDSGPVFLIKEDNVVSEQTFEIVLQVSESSPSGNITAATLNKDYTLSFMITSFVLQFLANQQMLNFVFTLLNDNFPEGTESFLITSAPAVMTGSPAFFPPVNLSNRALVKIVDDDCKFL